MSFLHWKQNVHVKPGKDRGFDKTNNWDLVLIILNKIVVGESHHFVGKSIVEDASVTLSLKRYFVNVVGCS